MERIELSPNGLEPLILPLNYTLLLLNKKKIRNNKLKIKKKNTLELG